MHERNEDDGATSCSANEKLRRSISKNINKEIHEKYTRSWSRKWWITVWKSVNRADSIYSLAGYPTFWTWFKSSTAHEEERDGAVKVSPRFTILREQRPACSLSRTRSLLRIGPITKIQNTKYILIINFFL